MDTTSLFMILAIFSGGLFLILALIGLILLIRLKKRAQLTRPLNMKLLLITLPKKLKKNQENSKNDKEIIAVMEQLYAGLSNIRDNKNKFLYGQPYLAFEISTPQVGEEISFYLAVPRSYQDLVEKQIQGIYPEAVLEEAEDYNIFSPGGVSAGSLIKLSRSYVLPFKTYQNLEADPLAEITNTLSKLKKEGEGAAIQIIFQPATNNWQSFGQKIAFEMQQGKKFDQAKAAAKKGSSKKVLDEMVKFSNSNQAEKKQADNKAITPGQEEIIKSLERKSSKVGFLANIRLIVSAQDKTQADNILSHLESAFGQFNDPNLNSLKIVRPKGDKLKKLIYQFSFRLFDQKQALILNTEEMTSFFHFPSATIETPKVRFVQARSAAPPANLPLEGVILGKNVYRGQETVIRMKHNDRRRHLYIIGQTGTGKSSIMTKMIVQDIKDGQGVGLIDPHGDLVEAILGQIPKERADDVIVFNPADLDRPLGLNMLEYNPAYPEQKTFIVNEVINIFDKLYDLKTTGGPMFEQYTRNSLLLLMDDPQEEATLMDVPRVLADKEFRARLLAKCRNVVVRDFWEKEAEKAGGEASLQNMVPYITSKFNTFIANDYMRVIIGQPKSSFNFRKIMDEKKILLVNLSKGRLGDINSALLGLIVTGKILMAAFSRIDLEEDKRNDFYFYIDEFQNFATDSISTILSEARKYRLCLSMAHQFIGQLDDKIKDAVFGNVGSIAAFRVGANDAEFLQKQFEPVFDQNDLINIANFTAYVNLMIDNKSSQPFNLTIYPPDPVDLEKATIIKELSRLKYGAARNEVEEKILQKSRI